MTTLPDALRKLIEELVSAYNVRRNPNYAPRNFSALDDIERIDRAVDALSVALSSTEEEPLTLLRDAGWMVAVHNDYRLAGVAHTFWLFTHPDGHWAKGEGRTDAEALAVALANARTWAPTASTQPGQRPDWNRCPECGEPETWASTPKGWRVCECKCGSADEMERRGTTYSPVRGRRRSTRRR